jgi:predicted transcriptional regulator
MEDLIALAVEQNFVPVLDDEDIFIGIIRRREIMQYCAQVLKMSKIKAELDNSAT